MNTRKLPVSVMILVGVLFSACMSPSGGTPSVTAPAPSPTAVPTSVQTTISPKQFKIPISITFGSDWYHTEGDPERIQISYRPSKWFIDIFIVDHVTLLAGGNPPARIPFPDDFAGYLQSTEFWSEVTAANPVSIGGANGYQVDAIGKSSASTSTVFLKLEENGGHRILIYPTPQKYRFYYFENISGSRVLIAVGTNDPNLVSASQFDEILPEVQEVLDTVTFGG